MPSMADLIRDPSNWVEVFPNSRLSRLHLLGWDAEYESFLDRVRDILAQD